MGSALKPSPHRCSNEVTRQLQATATHKVGRDGIVATRLCTHQDDVALTNERRLQDLPGEQGTRTRQYQLGGAIRQVCQPPLHTPGSLVPWDKYLGPKLCGHKALIFTEVTGFERCDLERVKVPQPENAGSES